VFINVEDTFQQHRDGLLGDGAYRAFLAAFRQNMSRQAFRFVWRLSGREAADQEFAEFVEKLMDETPLLNSSDLLDMWKSELADPLAMATGVP
jgi:hypothetical protein